MAGKNRIAVMSQDDDLPDFEQIGSRWPKFLLEEFRLMKPVAVWVAGSRDLISVTVKHANGAETKFGDGNRQCRALKLGLSRHWNDEVSWRVNQVPYFEQRLLCRIWVKTDDDAKLLMMQAVELFSDRGEPTELLKDWIDVGPDYKLENLGSDLVEAAHNSMVEYWSDHALVAHLLTRVRQRRVSESRAKVRIVSGGRR